MSSVLQKKILELVKAAHIVDSKGLLACSSGNMSCRIDNETMLCTRTRSWLGRITAKDIVPCRIKDGSSLDKRKPTVEIKFHSGIMQTRKDVNWILHFQSPFATAVACMKTIPNLFIIPEIPYYIGKIAIVPYLQPGSEPLAKKVIAAAKKHNLIIMRNHGLVTLGESFDEILQNAIFFELACSIVMRLGELAKPIPKAGIKKLLRPVGGKPGVGASA